MRFILVVAVWWMLGELAWAEVPQANLEQFRKEVEPVLKAACVGCHGPKKQKGKFRVDTLDPDLLKGKDVSRWLEMFDVISNGEMPPEEKIVIKPIHGYGGKNILFVNKLINQTKVLNYIKKFGHVMVQKFIPQITKGDKRVFIINGLVKGAIQRVPRKGSFISNLAQGGKATKTELNYRESKISKVVAKHLKKSKIFFAGIDLVSNYLIGDINVTSPTGLKNFKDLSGINLAEDFWNNLEKLK